MLAVGHQARGCQGAGSRVSPRGHADRRPPLYLCAPLGQGTMRIFLTTARGTFARCAGLLRQLVRRMVV